MRKSLIITLLLLILSLSGILAAHAGIGAKKDAVTLSETVLYGNKSAAEGLLVNVDTHCNYRLFWNTAYRVGETPQINTNFRFSQKEEHPQYENEHSGVSLGLPGDISISTSEGMDLDLKNDRYFADPHFRNMRDLYKDVASRTEAGRTHREQLYLKDYYEFYPLEVSIDLPDYQQYMQPLQAITDFFRIPVRDDHRLSVIVTKNDRGLITEITSTALDDSGASIWTTGTVAKDACYFTFSNQTDDGKPLDTSLIPGGYGIYRLPFSRGEGKNDADVFPEKLEMVYALDPKVQIMDFVLTEDKSKLLLTTRENGTYCLTVLDARTVRQLQKLKVIDCDAEVYPWPFYYDDFITVFASDGRFTVIEVTGSGEYRVAFTVATPESGVLGMPGTSSAAMGWDGEKLAVAEFQLYETNHGHYYARYQKCGFLLSVYDAGGLLFAGNYDSSLEVNQGMDLSYLCEPLGPKPISLHWDR